MRGSRKPPELFTLARQLRTKGYSYAEIASQLRIAKNTAFLWTQKIIIGDLGRARLQHRSDDARRRSGWTQYATKNRKIAAAKARARTLLEDIGPLPAPVEQVLLAMLYWCEGAKDDGTVKFTNSDPALVARFLQLLRQSFHIDEHRLRVSLHLHDYHNEKETVQYWSNVTSIPTSQFYPPHRKNHTGKRRRVGYPGCVCINYASSEVARDLLAIARTYLEHPR